jgi:putative SOS response-associated peptidase YedK
MCGRYSNVVKLDALELALRIERVELFKTWEPSYNIAPSRGPGFEQLIVIPNPEGERTLRLARWSLIPSFWQQPVKALPPTFNARSEAIERRSLWRDAVQNQRCLVPATGWREFKGPKGHKQPYHFHLSEPLFCFAGIWSSWESPTKERIDSFAIITTAPNEIAARIHDRMPLVLSPTLYDAWLNPSSSPRHVLDAAAAAAQELPLRLYASDPIGNDVHYQGERAVAPAASEP